MAKKTPPAPKGKGITPEDAEVAAILADGELFFKELKTDLKKSGEAFKKKLETIGDLLNEASDGDSKFKESINYFNNMVRDLALFPFEIDEQLNKIEDELRGYHARREEAV